MGLGANDDGASCSWSSKTTDGEPAASSFARCMEIENVSAAGDVGWASASGIFKGKDLKTYSRH